MDLVTLKFGFWVIGGTMQTEAPRSDQRKILASEEEIFRLTELGAQVISLTGSL